MRHPREQSLQSYPCTACRLLTSPKSEKNSVDKIGGKKEKKYEWKLENCHMLVHALFAAMTLLAQLTLYGAHWPLHLLCVEHFKLLAVKTTSG